MARKCLAFLWLAISAVLVTPVIVAADKADKMADIERKYEIVAWGPDQSFIDNVKRVGKAISSLGGNYSVYSQRYRELGDHWNKAESTFAEAGTSIRTETLYVGFIDWWTRNNLKIPTDHKIKFYIAAKKKSDADFKTEAENWKKAKLISELELPDKARLKRILEIVNPETLKLGLENIDPATLKIGLEVIDRATLKVGLEVISKAKLKEAIECIDPATLRNALIVIDKKTLETALQLNCIDDPTFELGVVLVDDPTYDVMKEVAPPTRRARLAGVRVGR